MKKIFRYLFLTLLVMGVASCSDDILVNNEGGEQNVGQKLSVTGTIVEDATTRVSLADGGTSITPSWEVDDLVFGFYGSDSKLTYQVERVSDGVATFSLVSGTEPTDGTKVHMIYAPAKSASDLNGGQLTVDLSQQDGTLAGVKNHAIMCATATVSEGKLTLSFLNQVAILGVKQFTGLKASTAYTSATFTSAGPTATVKVEGGVLKLVTDDAYGTITATGSFASNESGNTTSTIYFTVPPTDAVEHQFTLVCDDDYRIGAISAKAVAAGKYLYMSSKALRECVDLGLPSHTLWAATNIGATTPEGFGDYFAWGEVGTQASGRYWWDSYKWGNASSSNSGLTKYNSTDGLTRLLPEDDAATVNWKNSWRIPTKDEFDELINTTYTTLDWTTQNGVSGMKITSKVNGKSIFLPAAGLKDYGDPNRDPGACNYPTSDVITSSMSNCYKYVYNSNRSVDSNYGRCAGRPVRAVIAPPATYNNSAPADPNLLPGDFSVSATKKIKFTKGNLYYNTSEALYHLETVQSNSNNTSSDDTWNADHVSHFFWVTPSDAETKGKEPWATVMGTVTQTSSDKFFCGLDNPLTVDGTSDLYTLTKDEWDYLLFNRTQTNRFAKAVVNSKAGLLLFPDGYTGTANGTGIAAINITHADFPSASIPADTWTTMESEGVVFLPAAGCRNATAFDDRGSFGYYWTATPSGTSSYAFDLRFKSGNLLRTDDYGRSFGRSVRLVKTAQ